MILTGLLKMCGFCFDFGFVANEKKVK